MLALACVSREKRCSRIFTRLKGALENSFREVRVFVTCGHLYHTWFRAAGDEWHRTQSADVHGRREETWELSGP
jgi:hypothetical protein